MKTAYLLFGLLCIFVSTCGTREVSINQNAPTSQQTQSQDDELQNQIKQIASATKGHVGVAAAVLETGKTVSLNPHDHFPMQSVYKLPIGMAVMQQVDAGTIRLEQKVRVEKSDMVGRNQRSPLRDQKPDGGEFTISQLLRFMIEQSDGTASDVLLKLIGVDTVGKYLNQLGITEMVVANTEKEIGQDWETQYRNWASPESALQLLRALHEQRAISKQSQALLLKLMTETPTGPKRLKGLLPAGTIVAHKTGTSGTVDGLTAATNDIGLVSLPNGRHLAIAVFVSDFPADVANGEEVIAKIAKAVWDRWR